MSYFKSPAARLASTFGTRRSHAPFPKCTSIYSARGLASGPPYGPVGVARALDAASSAPAGPTLFTHEFSLADRVALVTGGNRGIGLEMALALAEAGARAVYCIDLSEQPGEHWTKVRDYLARMNGMGRFEYINGDVRNQEQMWKIGETIGDREGRMDVCVAAAGILTGDIPVLDHPAERFQAVMDVNTNGVLFASQAAGRQMARFGHGGSIIMVASICGSVALEPTTRTVSYHSSKAAVLQMARSMACELGSKRIRVNTISPGFIYTMMTNELLDDTAMFEHYKNGNPLGRIGRPEELRGVVAWLASDASSYCTGSDIIVSGGHHAW